MLITRSSSIATLTIAVVLSSVLWTLTSDCQAQRRRFVPGQELGRFLGLGHGAGYHCLNPGQNTDYYNPYSAHNSNLIAGNYPYHDPYSGFGGSYAGFDTNMVPHASYTNGGQDQRQHSVFESLPGQTVQPQFEPAVDRTRKKRDEADFDPDFDSDNELDFDPDEDFSANSRSDFDTPSTLDDLEAEGLAGEGDGDFDSLKSTFDEIQREESLLRKSSGVGEGFLD